MRARGEGRYHPRQPSRAIHPSTTTPAQPASPRSVLPNDGRPDERETTSLDVHSLPVSHFFLSFFLSFYPCPLLHAAFGLAHFSTRSSSILSRYHIGFVVVVARHPASEIQQFLDREFFDITTIDEMSVRSGKRSEMFVYILLSFILQVYSY